MPTRVVGSSEIKPVFWKQQVQEIQGIGPCGMLHKSDQLICLVTILYYYILLQVVIPQYPGDQSQFQTSKTSLSAEEAKILAAEITLFHLSVAGRAAALTEGNGNMSILC
jgi:hypothetical protein